MRKGERNGRVDEGWKERNKVGRGEEKRKRRKGCQVGRGERKGNEENDWMKKKRKEGHKKQDKVK